MKAGDLPSALRCLMDRVVEETLLDGATPWELDEELEARGWGRGPLLSLDREGLDVGLTRRRAAGEGPLPVLDRMVQEGRLGPKVGVGFYRYPGGGGAVIDPLIDDLIAEEAHFARRTRASMPQDMGAASLMARLREARDEWSRDEICTPADFDHTLHDAFGVPLGALD